MSQLTDRLDRFIFGEAECFGCCDCDKQENCGDYFKTVQKRNEIVKHHDTKHDHNTCNTCQTLRSELGSMITKIEECAWQRCDCRSRY